MFSKSLNFYFPIDKFDDPKLIFRILDHDTNISTMIYQDESEI